MTSDSQPSVPQHYLDFRTPDIVIQERMENLPYLQIFYLFLQISELSLHPYIHTSIHPTTHTPTTNPSTFPYSTAYDSLTPTISLNDRSIYDSPSLSRFNCLPLIGTHRQIYLLFSSLISSRTSSRYDIIPPCLLRAIAGFEKKKTALK